MCCRGVPGRRGVGRKRGDGKPGAELGPSRHRGWLGPTHVREPPHNPLIHSPPTYPQPPAIHPIWPINNDRLESGGAPAAPVRSRRLPADYPGACQANIRCCIILLICPAQGLSGWTGAGRRFWPPRQARWREGLSMIADLSRRAPAGRSRWTDCRFGPAGSDFWAEWRRQVDHDVPDPGSGPSALVGSVGARATSAADSPLCVGGHPVTADSLTNPARRSAPPRCPAGATSQRETVGSDVSLSR